MSLHKDPLLLVSTQIGNQVAATTNLGLNQAMPFEAPSYFRER